VVGHLVAGAAEDFSQVCGFRLGDGPGENAAPLVESYRLAALTLTAGRRSRRCGNEHWAQKFNRGGR
jgi:hypothetical protein